MLNKNQFKILLGVVVGIILIVIISNREHLTGNAPKELPLPSELKRSEITPLSEKDKARLDPRDIPVGFSSEADYLLSPETVQQLKQKTTPSVKTPEQEKEEKLKKISELEKQLEEMKKQL